MRILFIIIFFSLPTFALAREVDSVSSERVLCDDQSQAQCFKKRDLSEAEIAFRAINFDHAVSGDSFVADDQEIHLWGINAPGEDSNFSLASKMFLQTMLSNGKLTCKKIQASQAKNVMHCFIDGLDAGSMVVQMGMAEQNMADSAGYYQFEEDLAKTKKRGIWKASGQ